MKLQSNIIIRILFFMAIFMLFRCNLLLSQNEAQDVYEENLLSYDKKIIIKNNISKIKVYKYDINKKEDILQTFVKFNKNGDKVEEISYYPNGEIYLKYIWYYKNNKIVSEEEYKSSGNNKKCALFKKIIYKYDKLNNNIEKIVYNQEGLEYIDKKSFDNRNHLQTVLTFNAKGQLETFNKYVYNEQGLKIKEENYLNDSSFLYKWEGKYKNNLLIEELVYRNLQSVKEKYIYKYDTFGNKVEKQMFLSDKSKANKWEWKYDEKGNIIEKNEKDVNGNILSKNVYQYDDKGNMINEKEYQNGGKIVLNLLYKYDVKNNLIEKKSLDEQDKIQWIIRFDI